MSYFSIVISFCSDPPENCPIPSGQRHGTPGFSHSRPPLSRGVLRPLFLRAWGRGRRPRRAPVCQHPLLSAPQSSLGILETSRRLFQDNCLLSFILCYSQVTGQGAFQGLVILELCSLCPKPSQSLISAAFLWRQVDKNLRRVRGNHHKQSS